MSANLIDINDAGNIVMRVETTPKVQSTRQSVRISTKLTYTGALIIMDSVHMPTGCGTWPAFWSDGTIPRTWSTPLRLMTTPGT